MADLVLVDGKLRRVLRRWIHIGEQWVRVRRDDA